MNKSISLCLLATTLVLAMVAFGGCEQAGSDAAETGEPTETGQYDSAGQPNAAPGSDSQAAAPAPPPAPRKATLPAGLALKARTTNTLSTASVKPGESFTASLEEPIIDGTWVIAEKGSTVYGKIVSADPGGRVKGRASLSVRLTELQTSDGQRIAISTGTHGVQARATKKEDATKVGIASGVGAAIGAIAGGGSGAAKGAGIGAGAGAGVVLATRGDPAVIPSESVLTFSLSEPVTVTQR